MASFDNSLENIGHKGSFVGIGMGWAHASTGPLDYFKLATGEGGIRTPRIISGPGVVSGEINSSFGYVTDVMPTLLEYAGLKHPKTFNGREIAPIRGKSLVPIASGNASAVYGENDAIGAEMNDNKWMRKGDYKAVLVSNGGFGFGSGEWRLYNVVKDPGETNDLSTAMPELFSELLSAWEQYASDVGVVPAE